MQPTQHDPYQEWTDRLALLLSTLDGAIATAREQQAQPLLPARSDPTSPDEELPADTVGSQACCIFLELQDSLTQALVAATNDLGWLRTAVELEIREEAQRRRPNNEAIIL